MNKEEKVIQEVPFGKYAYLIKCEMKNKQGGTKATRSIVAYFNEELGTTDSLNLLAQNSSMLTLGMKQTDSVIYSHEKIGDAHHSEYDHCWGYPEEYMVDSPDQRRDWAVSMPMRQTVKPGLKEDVDYPGKQHYDANGNEF